VAHLLEGREAPLHLGLPPRIRSDRRRRHAEERDPSIDGHVEVGRPEVVQVPDEQVVVLAGLALLVLAEGVEVAIVELEIGRNASRRTLAPAEGEREGEHTVRVRTSLHDIARDLAAMSHRSTSLLSSLAVAVLAPNGVDTLERAACRCTWAEVAKPLGIFEELAEMRHQRLKDNHRRRMAKLGLLPDRISLRLIVSGPQAISRLRKAA
jgi:hypothetical protein